jgi:hypothetical protein
MLSEPGDSLAGVRIKSTLAGFPPERVRRILSGLPEASGYDVRVKPLRYRERPHLAAMTEFATKTITLQLPEPFHPFGEVVPYGARRRPGNKIRFIWLTEGVTFRTEREVLRFLYCHEWMHWYLKERLGKRSAAETTCDRFALRNYRRRLVTEEDAQAALRPERVRV